MSLLSLSILFASPCFEELETVMLSVIASSASRPQLVLPGVERKGESLFPEEVVFKSSDVSAYPEALRTRPKGISLLDMALFSASQNTPMMKKIQAILLSLDLEKGDLIVDGKLKFKENKEPEEMALAFSGDLSSIDLSVTVDISLLAKGKVWNVEGEMKVKGDSKGYLVVDSKEFTVNESKYKVDLKYRLKAAD